jgi:hypothetical protein
VELTCDRCGRSSYVPDELVEGRAFRARCPDCEGILEVPAERKAALDDRDLAWLASDGGPPEPPPAEPLFERPDVTERKAAAFERSAEARRRRRGLALAAAGAVAVAAAAAAIVLVAGRPGGGGPAAPRPRPAEAEAVTPAAAFDASGLAARPAADPPPAAAPRPGAGARVVRGKAARVTRDDRQLLDLLARKGDVAVVAPEGEPVDGAASALDADAVGRTVAANRKAFDACVSRALRLDPGLRVARRATLVLTVQPSGAVAGAFIAEEAVDRSDLGACLSAAARRMVFPGFEGEAIDVSMPLSLSAGL